MGFKFLDFSKFHGLQDHGDRKPQIWDKFSTRLGKSILEVPDTGTWVLDNTRPFLHSSIVSFWITPARSKERKYHIFRQYWYTRNVPVFTNTGTFQYLGPEVYFFPRLKYFDIAQFHNSQDQGDQKTQIWAKFSTRFKYLDIAQFHH